MCLIQEESMWIMTEKLDVEENKADSEHSKPSHEETDIGDESLFG